MENDVNTEEATSLALAIARGEDPIRRIVTMRWFSYDIEGDDVVLDEGLKAKIEEIGGSRLVEVTPEEYPGDRVLRFENVALAVERLCEGVPQP